MRGRQRQRALEARVDRLAGKVVVVETLGGMVIGLMLRAIPDIYATLSSANFAKALRRALRRAASADIEAFQLEIEEFAQQFLDQIEGVARREL